MKEENLFDQSMSSISAKPGFNSNNAVDKFTNSQETSLKTGRQVDQHGNIVCIGSRESSISYPNKNPNNGEQQFGNKRNSDLIWIGLGDESETNSKSSKVIEIPKFT